MFLNAEVSKKSFCSNNIFPRYILECETYTVLNTFDRKDTHSTVKANTRCDNELLVNGWYRFEGAAGMRL